MNRRCQDLETLTCVEKFQIRLKCVKLWSGELGVVDWEPAVSGWLHRCVYDCSQLLVNFRIRTSQRTQCPL
jgi:hypothetical protein